MFDLDRWQEIFSIIGRNKLRTTLTCVGIFWAIFTLMVLLGAGQGLQNSVEYQFKDDAVNSLWVYPGSTGIPHNGLPVGRNIRLYNSDYELIDREIEQAEYLTGRYYLRGEFGIKRKDKVGSYNIRSVHPDHKYLENTEIVEGRFINEADLKKRKKVAVIGKIVKEGLFNEDEDVLGGWININEIEYKVVGVFEDKGGENEMRQIYLPITTAQLTDNANNRIHQLMMTTGDVTLDESKQIESELYRLLGRKYNFSEEDREAIYISNDFEEYQRFQMVFLFIKGFVWIVAIGTLFAGVISISNVMLITVKERTREIGVRKALGATPFSIVSTIIQESVFLTAVAGYIGMLSGLLLVEGMNQLVLAAGGDIEFFRHPEVSPMVAVVSLAIVVCAGGLAGLIPAIRAARISPVEAMNA